MDIKQLAVAIPLIALLARCSFAEEGNHTLDTSNAVTISIAHINEFMEPSFTASNYIADMSFGWLINYKYQDPTEFVCHDCGVYFFIATNGLVNIFYAKHPGWTTLSLPASNRGEALTSAWKIAETLDANHSDFQKVDPLPNWRITFRPRIFNTDLAREAFTLYLEEGSLMPIWFQREYQSYDGFNREP